jgi:hypothetical protein
MSATACCTSKPIIYQIQVITTRSQYAPIVPRTTLSPSSSSSSIISISELHTPIKLNKAIKNDVNNNNNTNNQITTATHQEASNITNDNETVDNIDEERFLAFVGLRNKRKKKSVPLSTARPLAKRLAAPICLLPLPKYGERVRQALYILLPFLKFLSITYDIERFCSTDGKSRMENILPRSATQTRKPKTTQTKTNKRKVSKSGNVRIDDKADLTDERGQLLLSCAIRKICGRLIPDFYHLNCVHHLGWPFQ